MAIHKVSQIGAGRASDFDKELNRTYFVFFQVIVDDPYDGGLTVRLAVDPNTGLTIPVQWVTFYFGFENSYDLFAYCSKVEAQQDGNEWKRWIVKCTFTTDWQEKKEEDPTDDAVISWVEIETERRKKTQEYNGTPCLNSAGQLMDMGEFDVDLNVYCFKSNESQQSPLIDQGYSSSINKDSFLGKSPGTLRLKISTSEPQRRKQYLYYPHTYRLKYDPDGWDVDPIDQGTAIKKPDGTLGSPPPDADQHEIATPFSLDGKGNLLQPSKPIVYVSKFAPGRGVAGAKRMYRPKAFTPALQFLIDNLAQ